jgi:hypothetical protein
MWDNGRMPDGIPARAEFTRSHGRWCVTITAPPWLIDDFVREWQASEGIGVLNSGGSTDAGALHTMMLGITIKKAAPDADS